MDLEKMAGTGEERWSACFQGPSNEPFLLVREFLGGDDASVQLLIHQHSGKLIIRKVPHSLAQGKVSIITVTAAHVDKVGEDNELRMVKYLAPFAGRHPKDARVYQLIDDRIIEVERTVPRDTNFRRAPGSGEFLRESFWEYYNVGNLDDLAMLYQKQLLYPPPSLVARIIHRVLSSVHFMLSSGRGVQHCDLHLGNIFAHWKYTDLLPKIVLADFGDAQYVGENASNRAMLTRDMVLTDVSVFGEFFASSWYCSAGLKKDVRFAALTMKLQKLHFQDLAATIQEARLLESACLDEEDDDKARSYYRLFEAHHAQNPCVARTWRSKDLAQRGTRDLPGPFELTLL